MQKGQGIIFVIVGILVAGLIAGGAYYLGRSNNPKSTSVSVVPSPTPDETAKGKTNQSVKVEYPPLYPKVEWESTRSATLSIILNDDYSKRTEMPAYQIESKILKSIPKEWFDYYIQYLNSHGWQFDVQFAAGGGPAVGGDAGYKKEGHYFVLKAHHVGSQENPIGYKLTILFN